MNKNNYIIPPPPKSVFILNFLIFNGLFGFVFLYAWYTRIIPVEELAKFLTAFPTLIALILNITIPTVLYRMFINVFFMGSGTTAIGALKSQRHYIGYEINNDYINLANERIYSI
ncbi:hypothetical protein TPHV1_310002 [Treponema phagedenis]|uniref:DNA methylase N-4/N-6 domain-containing protein n=1 Tax=Treponema phagedenis TaxID=162 RepID=A0A0B7GV31_TREPH|nr:DNA methyltransferase [Treponema phagedenis]CEM62373.1 hypothetical protein TPHV1_310002 [Treponema phagedenis]